jgi:hypothetical protein
VEHVNCQCDRDPLNDYSGTSAVLTVDRENKVEFEQRDITVHTPLSSVSILF